MPALGQIVQPLRAGERLSREEFLRRWEALPSLKRAELIEGTVYLPSPVGNAHSWIHFLVNGWLAGYVASTPGCRGGIEGTWLMLDDAPQPDVSLTIIPEHGGQSRVSGLYSKGAPELAAEICYSSKSHDLGPKLELYRRAGVREYIAVVLEDSKIEWRYLVEGQYLAIEPDNDGVLRSRVFPGLWLDSAALLANDSAQLLKTLQLGLKTSEHATFVEELASRAPR